MDEEIKESNLYHSDEILKFGENIGILFPVPHIRSKNGKIPKIKKKAAAWDFGEHRDMFIYMCTTGHILCSVDTDDETAVEFFDRIFNIDSSQK